MTLFHTTERLGAVQSTTKEGFLICEGVPISRTGILLYAPGELPIPPGPDGLIRVHRNEDAVFLDASLRSFEGKSVVDLHPGVDVTPSNWRRFAVGHVQHVRRGEGANADKVIADLVVKDAAAIAAIRAGKRHVSCGYDAHYRVFAPGNAQQTNIIGNHVALVPQGRAGATCSIGDADMPAATSRTFLDRIRSAFQTQDEAALNHTLAELGEPSLPGAGSQAPVINIHTRDFSGGAADGADALEAGGEFHKLTADALSALHTAVQDMGVRLTAIDGSVKALEEARGVVPPAPVGPKTGSGPAAQASATATADSAALASVFQDAVSRAELLLPGVAHPTFDAKAAASATEEALTGFRRRVLQAAHTSGTGRAHVVAMLPAGADISAMTADAIGLAFQGATELAKNANNRGGLTPAAMAGQGAKRGPTTPAEINARNREFYKQPA